MDMKQPEVKIELSLCKDFFSLRDSMCYDSGLKALEAKITTNNDEYKVVIETQGHVRFIYKGDVYKCASQMPDELIQKFYEGTAYDNDDTYCDENNWWEVEVYKNGDYVDWLGGFMDFSPCDFKDEEDIKQYLIDTIFPE